MHTGPEKGRRRKTKAAKKTEGDDFNLSGLMCSIQHTATPAIKLPPVDETALKEFRRQTRGHGHHMAPTVKDIYDLAEPKEDETKLPLKCVNGCDAVVEPPSTVLCKSCKAELDK